ncbi:MAG: acylphosphatase [Gammaproteobacteria bacterium]|nr:acylphosphatase [Gammaproteobacteria bacterium]
MKTSIHFLVSGRVQGVCFRMHTRQQALQHDLAGWVRNLPDGRVEGMASGATADLEFLQAWLRRGPERALVTSVEVQALAYQPFDGFVIK